MFVLKVRYHAREEGYRFREREDADKVLASLSGKIGKKWYGKNGDEEEPIFKIIHAAGEAAIILEKVESVAVYSVEAEETLFDEGYERGLTREVRLETFRRKVLADAGLPLEP